MSESVRWHKQLSIKVLWRRLVSAPMLLVLLPFVAGILLASSFTLPVLGVVVALCVAVALGWLTQSRRMSWGYVAVALLLFGYLVAEYRTPRASMPYNSVVEMDIVVSGIPAQREGYRVAKGRVIGWREDDEWSRADDKVQLWLRNDTIGNGDRVVVYGRVRERMSRFEGYDKLLRNRGYIGGVSIESNILDVTHTEYSSLNHRAVRRLARYATDSLSHATAEAMVTGSRHAMPKQLREAYSQTGLSHLLAVSGLHLGIVLLVVMAMLMPLRLLHRGHRIANVVVIAALWLFAVMSGLSPSVVRAAIMLTMLQLARLTSSVSNSVNILAVTLFVMLLYRPSYLYDISFQLSALAVAGILLWGQPLVRRIGGPWSVKAVASTLIIGVVATLWTLPVVSYIFGNLPLAGVVITPVVMLFAYIVVAGGLFALLLPYPVAFPFAALCEWGARMQNTVVLWAAECGFTGVEYRISGVGVVLCYALFALITLVLWSVNRKKVITLPKYVDDI